MVIADLAFDLDSLSAITDSDERWKRLRELSRELARLQNGYNHSRRAALAWEKWRRKTDLEDTQYETSEAPHSDADAGQSQQPIPAAPNRPHETKYRTVYFTRCNCVCRKCHPIDGEYPYWEAEKDHAGWIKTGLEWLERDGESIHVDHGNCDCTCDDCEIRHAEWAKQNGSVVPSRTESRRTVHRTIYSTKCDCHGICQKCHSADGEYPVTQVEADEAALRAGKVGFIRRDKSVSIGLRGSFCECVCDACARKNETSMDPLQSPKSAESEESPRMSNNPGEDELKEMEGNASLPSYSSLSSPKTAMTSDFIRQQELLKAGLHPKESTANKSRLEGGI